jgi:hypothetical protein
MRVRVLQAFAVEVICGAVAEAMITGIKARVLARE